MSALNEVKFVPHPAADQPPDNDVIGYAEAAKVLNVALGTLYAWTSQRKIEHFRIGRRCVKFSRAKLLAFLAVRNVPIDDGGSQ